MRKRYEIVICMVLCMWLTACGGYEEEPDIGEESQYGILAEAELAGADAVILESKEIVGSISDNVWNGQNRNDVTEPEKNTAEETMALSTEESGETVAQETVSDGTREPEETLENGTEKVTQKETEEATEKTTQKETEKTTEKATEKETVSSGQLEPGTQSLTENMTETPAQPVTEAATQVSTEAAPPQTENPTSRQPEIPSEVQLEVPTEEQTEAPSEVPMETNPADELGMRISNNVWVYSDYAQRVIGLVNMRRKENGLPMLQYDANLCKIATHRCFENIDNNIFSHIRPNGTPCFTIFDEYGIEYAAAAENLAAGQTTPEQVVDAWMSSQGHMENILGDYNYIGVGIATDAAGCMYWAQCFAKYW